MTDIDRRSRWWSDLGEPEGDTDASADPWPVDDAEVGLSSEQIRFLQALADQPTVPRLSSGIRGIDDTGVTPVGETGD